MISKLKVGDKFRLNLLDNNNKPINDIYLVLEDNDTELLVENVNKNYRDNLSKIVLNTIATIIE